MKMQADPRLPMGGGAPLVTRLYELFRTIAHALNDLDDRSVLRGAGTPEGSVVAEVGRLYVRTDGGANTTLYVKESGTGNTGWVAK